jgi:hypothetical protein
MTEMTERPRIFGKDATTVAMEAGKPSPIRPGTRRCWMRERHRPGLANRNAKNDRGSGIRLRRIPDSSKVAIELVKDSSARRADLGARSIWLILPAYLATNGLCHSFRFATFSQAIFRHSPHPLEPTGAREESPVSSQVRTGRSGNCKRRLRVHPARTPRARNDRMARARKGRRVLR